MKKIFLYAAALASVAVACQRIETDTQILEEPTPEVEMITETVSGSRGSATKVTIANADGAFAWTAGDNIAVHISNGKYVYTSDAGASGASTAAASASFTVAYEAGNSRDAFAVYPSTIVDKDAANYGQAGHALDISLPDSYTLDELTGETTPCPMIASNTAGYGWDFYQLCGLLRLTVNTIPANAKRLEINFDGKQVSGSFSIASPVEPNSSVITTTDDASHDTITITKDGSDVTLNDDAWLDGLVLNIPLPTGTYTKITVTAYDALTGGVVVFTKARTFSYTAAREHATKRNLPAVFTVNNSKKVVFSPGNLRATTSDKGANWTWSFADNQYDYIGGTTANNAIDGDGTVSSTGTVSVDLFGFSTTNNYYGITPSSGDFTGDFKDWGTISTFSYRGSSMTYPSDYWRSLTANSDNDKNCDWRLLRDNRTTRATVNGTANARYTEATINTNSSKPVNGVVFFPDDFDGLTPEGVTWGTINATSAWGTKCTSEGWTALELAGCVFFPVTGGRRSGSSFYSTGEGFYWPNYSGSNCCIEFGNNYFTRNMLMGRSYGMAVRLVHQIN